MELDARCMNTALHLRCRAVFMHGASRSIRCSREKPISRYVFLLYAHSICESRSQGGIRCPVWNTSHTADFMIHVRGDATLTIGPYGSTGTCIINYAPPQINVVVMTLGIV